MINTFSTENAGMEALFISNSGNYICSEIYEKPVLNRMKIQIVIIKKLA